MSGPGYLSVNGTEVANNARTVAYLQLGLAGPEFQATTMTPCTTLLDLAFPGTGPQVFVSPAVDGAPWYDPAVPASADYLGLLILEMEGLDITSGRDMTAAVGGVGSILGPAVLDGRTMAVSGWVLSASCAGMEYGRRWLGEALAGALCDDCEGDYADVLLTCGDDDSEPWRMWDVGLSSFTLQPDDSPACCFVREVRFTMLAADPYLYRPAVSEGPPVVLNPGGADDPLIPFEDWLFGVETQTCVSLTDLLVGDDAAIFTFHGGTGGIEGGLSFADLGDYPSPAIFPGSCTPPCSGPTQWTMGVCPFAFTFSIGPGETFVIDNSRQLLSWYLSDGTLLDGASRMNMAPGDVIQWLDTCDAALDVCASIWSNCSADATATVEIATQHRER